MSKISCEIIKDLLPLYYDNVCSDDSKSMIETHLKECDYCRKELEQLQTDLLLSKEEIETNLNDRNVIEGLSSFLKRSQVKSFFKGAIIGIFLLIAYFGLFKWNITNVPMDVVEINQVSTLDDGKIVYYKNLTDHYNVNREKYEMDEEGNFYIIPKRPIINSKAHYKSSMVQDYDFFDIEGQEINRGKEIKAVYYGTPKDNKLIWKEGMNLPEASKEVKEMFRFDY